MTTTKLFEASVGNPPYQLDIHSESASRRVSVDIFPDLQEIALDFSGYTALIYPATWQKDVSQGLGRWMLDRGLYNSHFFPSQIVFGSAIRKNFPIAISACNEKKANIENNVIVNQNVIMPRESKSWIDHKAKEILVKAIKDIPTLSGGAHPVIRLSNAQDAPFSFSEKPSDDTVSVYIKRKAGFQADGTILHTDWDQLKQYVYNIDKFNMCEDYFLSKYKAAIPTAPLGRMGVFNEMIVDRKVGVTAKVFGPNELFSNTKACVKVFDTADEAQNFCDYLNSRFVSILLTLDYSRKTFASYVPDLKDYTNENPVFKSTNVGNHSITERLCDYFELDDYDKKVVLDAEFGGVSENLVR